MAYPTFGGFSLQDDNYITTEIEYRTWPTRNTKTDKIAYRPGAKLLDTEFGEKRIILRGFIKGSSESDLQSKIDDFHQNVSEKSQSLIIESGRTFTATASMVSISDPHYAVDIVPFELEFICADPFAYGSSRTVTMTVTSGVGSEDYTVTISGSVFAEPSITYATVGGVSGSTTTSGVKIELQDTGENVTWSGGQTTLSYGDELNFDYDTYKVLKNTTQENFSGIFSRWDSGSQTFTTTYSGTTQGGEINFTYSPRYL